MNLNVDIVRENGTIVIRGFLGDEPIQAEGSDLDSALSDLTVTLSMREDLEDELTNSDDPNQTGAES